jgi:hypothetical protein
MLGSQPKYSTDSLDPYPALPGRGQEASQAKAEASKSLSAVAPVPAKGADSSVTAQAATASVVWREEPKVDGMPYCDQLKKYRDYLNSLSDLISRFSNIQEAVWSIDEHGKKDMFDWCRFSKCHNIVTSSLTLGLTFENYQKRIMTFEELESRLNTYMLSFNLVRMFAKEDLSRSKYDLACSGTKDNPIPYPGLGAYFLNRIFVKSPDAEKNCIMFYGAAERIETALGKMQSILDKMRAEQSQTKTEPPAAAPASDIKAAISLMNEQLPAQLKEGKVYEVRYDSARLREYQRQFKISDENSPEALLKAYVQCLQVRVPSANPKDVVKLIECPSKDNLISVTCYEDINKQKVVGEGHVNVDGDLQGELRIIGMFNIAMAASNIPQSISQSELASYENWLAIIKAQYRDIAGKDFPAENILEAIRHINLPAIAQIYVGSLEEYYRLTIQQLQQAA